MTKRPAAYQIALRFLRRLVEDGRRRRRYRLPPVRSLAHAAAVSPVTMLKAVSRLRSEGLVTVRQGRGVTVAPGSPARLKASGFLRDTIARSLASGQLRLPNVAALADRAHVGYAAMWRAVDALRQEGVLATRPGVGTFVVEAHDTAWGATAVPRLLPEPKLRWQRVLAAIQDDIAGGLIAPDAPMPSCKQLTARYGVCHRTLAKALDTLVQNRVVEPWRKGYRLVTPSASGKHSSVVLIACGIPTGELETFTPRSQDSLRLVEAECAKHNVRLDIAPYHRITRRLLVDPGRFAPPMGVLLWDSHIDEPSLRELLTHRAVSGRPVAILHEEGPLPAATAAHGRTRVFSIANNSTAGRQVGRFLVDMGHRGVGYMSPYHSESWAQERLTGLCQAYAAAGMPDAVRPFLVGRLQSGPTNALFREVAALMVPVAERLDTRQAAGERTFTLLRERVARALWHASGEEMLAPLLEQALSDSGITAWVACNDQVAIQCLSYLERRKVRVPERISVVGFDDHVEAFAHGLASYNFNLAAVVQAMIGYVLGSGVSRIIRRSPTPVEIEGFVTQRHSCARAKQSTDPTGY